MHIRGKKKGVEGSDPRKGREREKGQSEKECEIKQVKDRLDKQKKSQLHTRREQHKRNKKTNEKIRCILKAKGEKMPLFPLAREEGEGAAEVQGQGENR